MKNTILLRIVDKKTLLFIRDDFAFDEETELGLNVSPDNKHGYKQRKWDMVNKKWIEAPEKSV